MNIRYRWIDFDAIDDAALAKVVAVSPYEPVFDVQLPGRCLCVRLASAMCGREVVNEHCRMCFGRGYEDARIAGEP